MDIQTRTDLAKLQGLARRLRDILAEIDGDCCNVGDIVDRFWGDVINAESSRHVAYKADFLPHFLLDLIWGLEREIEAVAGLVLDDDECLAVCKALANGEPIGDAVGVAVACDTSDTTPF